MIHCSKNRSLIFATRRRNTDVLSVPQLPYNYYQCAEILTCASWNMHRHVFTMIESYGSL